MTSQNQSTSALTDQTIQALSGKATSVSPADGTSLIDGWISALGPDSKITDTLKTMKTALQGGPERETDIEFLFSHLADQTDTAADDAEDNVKSSLKDLATSLRNFGVQLA